MDSSASFFTGRPICTAVSKSTMVICFTPKRLARPAIILLSSSLTGSSRGLRETGVSMRKISLRLPSPLYRRALFGRWDLIYRPSSVSPQAAANISNVSFALPVRDRMRWSPAVWCWSKPSRISLPLISRSINFPLPLSHQPGSISFRPCPERP